MNSCHHHWLMTHVMISNGSFRSFKKYFIFNVERFAFISWERKEKYKVSVDVWHAKLMHRIQSENADEIICSHLGQGDIHTTEVQRHEAASQEGWWILHLCFVPSEQFLCHSSSLHVLLMEHSLNLEHVWHPGRQNSLLSSLWLPSHCTAWFGTCFVILGCNILHELLSRHVRCSTSPSLVSTAVCRGLVFLRMEW